MTKFKYLVVIMSFLSFVKINALEDIKVNDETLSPLFDNNIHEYNYYTDKDSVKISVSKSSDEVVSGYGYFNIINGLNEFNITSDKNGNYKINVYKKYIKEDDSIATFKELYIVGYDINFKNNIFEYEIDIENENYLDIRYELDNSSSIVEITNNGNFNKSNNDVYISIKSKDGNNSNKYIIHVNKVIPVFKETKDIKELTNLQKEIIILLIIIVSCSFIVFVFYMLFIKKII